MHFDSPIKILEALFRNYLNETSKVNLILKQTKIHINCVKSLKIIETLPVRLNLDEAHLNG